MIWGKRRPAAEKIAGEKDLTQEKSGL